MKYICQGENCGREIVGRVHHCSTCNKLYCLVCFENHPCGGRTFKTGIVKKPSENWRHDKR